MLLALERRWECLRCGFTDVTREYRPHSHFHACRALGGFTTPMVPAGTKAELVVHEREDFIGGEDVQYAEGRPVAFIEIVRDDGNDVTAYAPTARAGSSA